jgi:hypothetical protein
LWAFPPVSSAPAPTESVCDKVHAWGEASGLKHITAVQKALTRLSKDADANNATAVEGRDATHLITAANGALDDPPPGPLPSTYTTGMADFASAAADIQSGHISDATTEVESGTA